MADSELLAKLNRRQELIRQKSQLEEKTAELSLSGDSESPQPSPPTSLHLNGHVIDEGHSNGHVELRNGCNGDVSPGSEHSTHSTETFSSSDDDRNTSIGGANDELKSRLARRQDINEGKMAVERKMSNTASVFAEFQEFSRKQLKHFEKTFRLNDENGDGVLDFEELKRMMERLGEPQTHLALKAMIREVDEDEDNYISFREFLLIFRKAAAGELLEDSGLLKLAQMTAVDVTKEGVGGARNFFEAKIEKLSQDGRFEAEIKAEQEEKRKELEEKKARRQEFLAKRTAFQQ